MYLNELIYFQRFGAVERNPSWRYVYAGAGVRRTDRDALADHDHGVRHRYPLELPTIAQKLIKCSGITDEAGNWRSIEPPFSGVAHVPSGFSRNAYFAMLHFVIEGFRSTSYAVGGVNLTWAVPVPDGAAVTLRQRGASRDIHEAGRRES
jgi:hypothetical protein